jgi:hypothetical protein
VDQSPDAVARIVSLNATAPASQVLLLRDSSRRAKALLSTLARLSGSRRSTVPLSMERPRHLCCF